MIEFSRLFSHGIPFLRVDLYDINSHPYLSELTLYPGAGFTKFVPDYMDAELGKLIELPKENVNLMVLEKKDGSLYYEIKGEGDALVLTLRSAKGVFSLCAGAIMMKNKED